MIDQKYIDLMNQELDGANSPAQSRELEEFLADNEEARTYYGELALALNVFEKVAMVDPPSELGAEILAQTGLGDGYQPPDQAPGESEGLWAACRDLFRNRRRLAHSLTFAAGLACGLLLLTGSSWLDQRHGNGLNEDVTGTVNHRQWNLDQVVEGHWDDPAVQGSYAAQVAGQDIRLHLKILAEEPAVIRISHGPAIILQHFDADNPRPARLAVSESEVEVNLEGRGSYDLEFHRNDKSQSPMSISVYTEGRLVHTESLDEWKN